MFNNNKPTFLTRTATTLILAGCTSVSQAEIVSTNEINGYIKLDAIFSSENDGAGGLREQALLTLNQNEPEDEEDDLTLSAFESRIKFTHKSLGTPVGDLSAVIEGDFYSGANQNIFNLRHAYFTQDNLTLGQTWSTFMDLGALAETADFGGPAARVFVRQSQIRYTFHFAKDTLEIAAEEPLNSPDPKLPDLVAKYTWRGNFGHIAVGALYQQINDDAEEIDEAKNAFAARVSGRINLGKDNLKFAVISGEGLGRYLNFGDQASFGIVNNEIELSEQTGYKLAYQHVFTPTLRSTVRYAKTENDLDGDDMGDFSSFHINLVYNPYKPLTFGAEIIRAEKKRTQFNGLDEDLELRRFQLFGKFAF
ncbi:DcaP family trimeric outer membrane transporter [Sessilibacter sp. MAH1]